MTIRCMKGHFTPENHFAYESAAWYWHFVDVVWIGLFFFVYILYTKRQSQTRKGRLAPFL